MQTAFVVYDIVIRKLETAYLQTRYVVEVEETEVAFYINDEQNESFDELLNDYKATTWAFITACNPFSKVLSNDENERRQCELKNYLTTANHKFLRGRGEDSSGNWRAEPSFLIFDIDENQSNEIGRLFEQNAVVFGEIYKKPKLIWCR
ncbi:MAG: DUF3293 domain-containing protein [Pyrinomonadaceae bacterium]|nr:DUF3293 domain-containing protein [Pyrinomonadaceae bacterium]